MTTPKWLLALPLALAAMIGMSPAQGATIVDNAKMFSAGAIQKAESELSRITAETKLPVTIETIGSLDGETVATVLKLHAQASGAQGVYVLIAKQEEKFDIEASRAYRGGMNASRLAAIKTAFVTGLKARDFDGALLSGVATIRSQASEASSALANAPRGRGGVAGRGNPQGGFGVGSLLGIGLLIVGVMFLFRILGGLFGGGAQQGQGPGMGRMGAPGYGGMGGGGGGFMSSLFGGIGGALAGNWLYDQFSGRGHQGYNESAGYGQSDNSAATDWSGGSDQSADWGGGGDTGAGGDWGGGGGGGDWGGGGGGGDW